MIAKNRELLCDQCSCEIVVAVACIIGSSLIINVSLLQDGHWQILVLVLLKGLSLHRIPALQDTFESRGGLAALSKLLQAQDFTSEMFDALLEELLEG